MHSFIKLFSVNQGFCGQNLGQGGAYKGITSRRTAPPRLVHVVIGIYGIEADLIMKATN